MVKRICDICGKTIPVYEEHYSILVCEHDTKHPLLSEAAYYDKCVCNVCWEKALETIKRIKK